jgi:ABC-2 type transport system permease protein
LPAFLLSGFAFPIANMPAPIQLITYLTPARYFVTAARSIYLKGLGPSFLWLEMLLLAAFAAALLTFALRKFVKRLA